MIVKTSKAKTIFYDNNNDKDNNLSSSINNGKECDYNNNKNLTMPTSMMITATLRTPPTMKAMAVTIATT